jgi:hypothetical protein
VRQLPRAYRRASSGRYFLSPEHQNCSLSYCLE